MEAQPHAQAEYRLAIHQLTKGPSTSDSVFEKSYRRRSRRGYCCQRTRRDEHPKQFLLSHKAHIFATQARCHLLSTMAGPSEIAKVPSKTWLRFIVNRVEWLIVSTCGLAAQVRHLSPVSKGPRHMCLPLLCIRVYYVCQGQKTPSDIIRCACPQLRLTVISAQIPA